MPTNQEIFNLLQLLVIDVKTIKNELHELRKKLNVVEDFPECTFDHELPVKDMAEFVSLDVAVSNKREEFIQFLRRLGGRDLTDHLRLIFCRLFSLEVLVNFTLLGTQEKSRFADSHIHEAIVATLRPKFMEKDINKAMGERFRLAPDKLKKKLAKISNALNKNF